MKYVLTFILALGICSPSFADRVFQNNDQEQISPISLRTAEFLIYVETNGRKISAVDLSSGKILWTRDPYEDWKLKPYRFSKPVITSLKLAKKDGWIDIRFNSSQFGVIQISTGLGYHGGND